MKKYLFQTLREYFSAIILTTLFCNILPSQYVVSMQSAIFYILGLVPVTFFNILLANLLTMLVIFIFGMLCEKLVSFFVVLNGVAFGVVISFYQSNLLKLFSLLFPHSFFETILIVSYCTLVKVFRSRFREYKRVPNKYWLLILCLWVLSAILESIFIK